jgi:hypothetical protein
MQILRIPKSHGKYRIVYAPSDEEKAKLRQHLPALTQIAQRVCHPEVVHGFMPGRSPLTNALPHIGFAYTLSMDFTDFFDTVLIKHVASLIPAEILYDVMAYGAARQGLPTSPIVANIGTAAFDRELLDCIGTDVTYTRYADDLSFSCDDRTRLIHVAVAAENVAKHHGFVFNAKKTRLQMSSGGRRIITGVAVDQTYAYATRAVRRKLRAARHQGNQGSAAGLAEWCRLRLPAIYREEMRAAERLLRQRKGRIQSSEDTSPDYGKAQRSLNLD